MLKPSISPSCSGESQAASGVNGERNGNAHIQPTSPPPLEVDNGVVVSGYSSTPQLAKLGIRAGTRFDVVGAASTWSFEGEPDAATRVTDGSPVDVLLAFFRAAADLDEGFEPLAERIRPAGALWVAWPRKSTGHASDISENLIREIALPRGLVDVKVAAIDTEWSGLKVVWRLENR